MTKEVEEVLSSYVAGGLGRLEAIRAALDEEKLERDVDGSLKLRSAKRRPGRQLLGI
jgi:hypothetical protein